MPQSPDLREKTLLFTPTEQKDQVQGERWRNIDERKFRTILGSPVYYDARKGDGQGDIYYVIWGPKQPLGNFLEAGEEDFVLRRPIPRQADIVSFYSRYQYGREGIVHRSESVETAIRAFDHVIVGIRKKERTQNIAMRRRAFDLLDKFSLSIPPAGSDEYDRLEAETYGLLASVHLDPVTVVNKEKERIAQWVLKGSTLRDSTDRFNTMIGLGALQAAIRMAAYHAHALDEAESKFLRGREALVLERQAIRQIFQDIGAQVRPSAMPATVAFSKPWAQVTREQKGIVTGLLNTMMFQFDIVVRVKPYKSAAKIIHEHMRQAQESLQQGDRAEAKKHLSWAEELIRETLEAHKDIRGGEER